MKLKVEKSTQIINDLILYLHSLGATHYQVELTPGADKISFTVRADIPDLYPEIFTELREALAKHRQREIEENYWAISYDSTSPCEPTLLGMMLDNTDVSYEDGILTISATR